MEVIQWTALWNDYKDEFENEKNLLGGSLVEKAAEDLKQRIIEHVLYIPFAISLYFIWLLTYCHCDSTCFLFFYLEYSCRVEVLLEDYIEETCRAAVSQPPGL